MKKLTKKEWKQLEKEYPNCIKNIFRPPLWAVNESIISETKFELTLNELSLLENEKSNMQYIGTAINDRDLDYYIEYYLSNDDKLYQYLYREKLEYIDDELDEENFDVIHTNNYICEGICICTGKVLKEYEN